MTRDIGFLVSIPYGSEAEFEADDWVRLVVITSMRRGVMANQGGLIDFGPALRVLCRNNVSRPRALIVVTDIEMHVDSVRREGLGDHIQSVRFGLMAMR